MKINMKRLTIKRGKTYVLEIPAETNPIVRKPVSGISFAIGVSLK